MKAKAQLLQAITIEAYNPAWPQLYATEARNLRAQLPLLLSLEHIGSTAIPGQRAKPIIDMMAAIEELDSFDSLLPALQTLGYVLIDVGMRERFFLRKEDAGQVFHLHVVTSLSWPERKERLMRDYLLEHPEDVKAYGALKDALAQRFAKDSLAYTRAKTDFIQRLMDKARAERGLAPINVWED